MSSYLPAPYESAADDDLAAAAAAALTGTTAVLIAVTLGRRAWAQVPATRDLLAGGHFEGPDLATVATTATWAVSAVLMVLGAVLLVVRRGRGPVLVGAAVGLAGTALARWRFDWFTPTYPLDNAAAYFGGIVVIVLALLPATRRWIAGRGRPRERRLPPVTTATTLTPTRIGIGQAR